MVRSGPRELHTIGTCLSSFLEPLNDEWTKSYLHTLAKTKLQASFQLHFNFLFIDFTRNKCSTKFFSCIKLIKIFVFLMELGQIIGIIQQADLFCPPYKPLCNQCKQIITTTHYSLDKILYCTNCGDKKLFSYEQSLQCTIKNALGNLDCILSKYLLQIFFSSLLQISCA